MSSYFYGFGRLLVFMALIAGIGLNQGAALAQGDQPGIQYSRAADEVVLEWDQVPSELTVKEAIPRLKIYGDGRFEVYYPVYMKNAGHYQGRLSAEEMSDLMSFLAQKGVMDFDRARLKEEKNRLSTKWADQTGQLTGIIDGTTTRITIRAQGYTTADGQQKVLSGDEKTIEAANIGMEAKIYPDLKMLTDLSAVESRLSALTRRQDLERMEQ